MDIFSYMSKKFIPLYISAKIIKIDWDFPKLWSQMYCHLFLWFTVYDYVIVITVYLFFISEVVYETRTSSIQYDHNYRWHLCLWIILQSNASALCANKTCTTTAHSHNFIAVITIKLYLLSLGRHRLNLRLTVINNTNMQ